MDYITYNILSLNDALSSVNDYYKFAKWGSIILACIELIFFITYKHTDGILALIMIGVFFGAWFVMSCIRENIVSKLNKLCTEKYGKSYEESILDIFDDRKKSNQIN